MQQTCDFIQLLTAIGLSAFAIFAAVIGGIIAYKIAAEAFRRHRFKKCYGKVVDWEDGDIPSEIIFIRPEDNTYYKTKMTNEARKQITDILNNMPVVTFYNNA